MRWIRNFCLGLILIGLVDSCLKQPEYSVVPQIQMQSLSFKKGVVFDTLIFVIKFTDGDGDLGIDPTETAIYTSSTDSFDINTPYYFIYDTIQKQILYYDHESDRDLTTIGPNLSYVDYKAKRTIKAAPFDTLPALSCKHWEIDQAQKNDTLYILTNLNSFNFFVNPYIKGSNGTYTYFDQDTYFAFGQCEPNSFYYRFPILSTDLGKSSPLDGTLTCKIPSAGLGLIFHAKTVKFSVYIKDRAFHTSNSVDAEYTFN